MVNRIEFKCMALLLVLMLGGSLLSANAHVSVFESLSHCADLGMVGQSKVLKPIILPNELNYRKDKSSSKVTKDDVVITVTGDGATKADAQRNALRSALEQVYGTYVSSNTSIMNDKLVVDEIVSVSNGYVKSFKYLSEKKIDSKYFVVIEAVITPQKLVSFATQRGASVELAGATFAANMRIKKLDFESREKAAANITKMQEMYFPKCVDCTIVGMEEPTQNGVRFGIAFYLNSNASYLVELENEKLNLLKVVLTNKFKGYGKVANSAYLNDYSSSGPSLFLNLLKRLRISDNLGEYWIEQTVDESKSKQNICRRIILRIRSNLAKQRLSFEVIGKDGYSNLEDFLHYNNCVGRNYHHLVDDYYGKIYWPYVNDFLKPYTRLTYRMDGFSLFGKSFSEPYSCFFAIEARMNYSLEDYDKITGINVKFAP